MIKKNKNKKPDKFMRKVPLGINNSTDLFSLYRPCFALLYLEVFALGGFLFLG